MTKILHIPSGVILTYLVVGNSDRRTTEYEESCYCEDLAMPDEETIRSGRLLPLKTADNFIASMCNRLHIDRHHRFKERFRIDRLCVAEEFELIQ